MEENFNIKNFSKEDVISFNAGICKAAKIIEQFRSILVHDIAPTLGGLLNRKIGFFVMPQYDLFKQGINCEVLKVGAKGWQKGKIQLKITLEFCPEETENNHSNNNNHYHSKNNIEPRIEQTIL
jgi:hypothetical protein